MQNKNERQSEKIELRAAFTLTEMLVSVGLMMLVMTMFAQIFSLAVTAMSSQKGLANNNQRARTAFIVMDNDLKRMSFRPIAGHSGIVPLVPGLQYNGEAAAPEQLGYIYYSENDPLNNGDDVLQFTIDGTQASFRYPDLEIDYYGKAEFAGATTPRDQPDWDDGTPGDGVSISQQAEIVYFLRRGTLYRRVLLLRDATSIPNNLKKFDSNHTQKLAQPANVVAGEPLDRMLTYGGNFYSDFDYSAHFGASPYDGDLITPPSTPNRVAVFHGSLSNSADNNWPLGVPHFRFGFSPYVDPSNPPTSTDGKPREYFTSGGTDYFFGCYTHEETSNGNFQYPQNNSGAVFTRNDFDKDFYLATGRLDVFQNTNIDSRRGADIMMNNVQSFDVEIWDPNANGNIGGFVDIASTNAGDFANGRKLNTAYGPVKPNNGNVNVFDTFHSLVPSELNAIGASVVGNGQPPFVPKLRTTAPAWTNDTDYFVGDIVVPSAAFITANSNFSRINGAIVYRCVTPGKSAEFMAGEPSWSRDVAVTDTFPDGPNSSGSSADWMLVDNRKPIRAMRIIIRFLDPTSDQIRQMTMVHSFNE